MLAGKLGVRAAAEEYRLPCPSHVQYYVDKYAQSELSEALSGNDRVLNSTEASPESVESVPPLLPEVPTDIMGGSKYSVKQWIAKQAAHLVKSGDLRTQT